MTRVLNRRRALVALALILAALAGKWGIPRLVARENSISRADPLTAFNAHFRDAYRRARIERLAQAGPVVLVKFDGLTLIRKGRRTEVPFPPPVYTELKQVAHTPLSVFVMLSGSVGRPMDAVLTAEVRYVRDLVVASVDTLGSRGFPASAVDRQRTILESTRVYLEEVLKNGSTSSEALTAYSRRMGPLMLANCADAAKAHLDRLNAQMEAWRAEMGPEEWKELHAVVMSVHMARDGEISMQYFSKLLGEPTEGRRLIFAEGLFDEPKALDLFGTHLLDGAASEAFFADPMRLHRDVLADGATDVLKTLTVRP